MKSKKKSTNQFTVHEAKSGLSKLIRLVESGDEVIICRGQVPVARLSAFEPKGNSKRSLGIAKGLIKIDPEFFKSEDWDEHLER